MIPGFHVFTGDWRGYIVAILVFTIFSTTPAMVVTFYARNILLPQFRGDTNLELDKLTALKTDIMYIEDLTLSEIQSKLSSLESVLS